MAPALDVAQQLVEACVTVLDTNADLVALTERPRENLLPWRRAREAEPPIVGMRIKSIVRGGGSTGDFRRVLLGFSAWGPAAPASDAPGALFGDAMANALLGCVERAFTAPALFAQGLDVFGAPVLTRVTPPPDPDDDAPRADLDVLLTVRFA